MASEIGIINERIIPVCPKAHFDDSVKLNHSKINPNGVGGLKTLKQAAKGCYDDSIVKVATKRCDSMKKKLEEIYNILILTVQSEKLYIDKKQYADGKIKVDFDTWWERVYY